MNAVKLCLVLMLGLVLPDAPAQADLAAGKLAFDRQDYPAARLALQEPAQASNAEAFDLLALMAHEGMGQPVNNLDAYMYLTLEIMADDPDFSPSAIPNRRHVARAMTLQDIRAAENQVAEWNVNLRGQDLLTDQIGEIVLALNACNSKCDEISGRVAALGPSGFLAMPRLEVLMTTDPMWMPRQQYTYALFAIGTKAVPVLCRIAEDKAQLALEGTWNLMQAASALGGMGPAASDGHACLLRALAGLGGKQPDLQEQLGRDLADDPDAMLVETERAIVVALVAIGDPSRSGYAAVTAAYRAQPHSRKAQLLSYLLGMTYGEVQPAIEQAKAVLSGETPGDTLEMLSILSDLSQKDGFAGAAGPLIPALTDLAGSEDATLQGLARDLLDTIQP